MSSPSPQSGNIFFYIFIGIVLFAALGYALSQSSLNSDQISDEKATLLAQEIIAQGNTLKDGISKLRLRGISDTQVSFENSIVSGYTNSSCTTADCKVFDPAGGNVAWLTPPQDAQTTPTNWGFSGNKSMDYSSSTNNDLVAVLPNLQKSVCDKINQMAGLSSTYYLSSGTLTYNKFTGAYSAYSPALFYSQRYNACIKAISLPGNAMTGATADSNYYYHILIAR